MSCVTSGVVRRPRHEGKMGHVYVRHVRVEVRLVVRILLFFFRGVVDALNKSYIKYTHTHDQSSVLFKSMCTVLACLSVTAAVGFVFWKFVPSTGEFGCAYIRNR